MLDSSLALSDDSRLIPLSCELKNKLNKFHIMHNGRVEMKNPRDCSAS
jgi:hypothetical protein